MNWGNPDAREAALSALDRWLARGVDGFRLDVANAFLHDPTLADNEPVPAAKRTAWHWSHAAHLQLHCHDSNLAANLAVLNEIRRRVERYPDRFVMGEFSEEPARSGGFASPMSGLHSGYSFPLLLADRLEPSLIRAHCEELGRHPGHWPSVAFSNHDVIRAPTRFGGRDAPPELARLLLSLLICLRGTVLLYQGEELGLPEAELRRDQIKDPVGDLYYAYSRGRDGCRTPMPWDAGAANLGFTSGAPWLPLSLEHRALAVSVQEQDDRSTLANARRLLAARRASAAIRLGDIEFIDSPAPVLAFVRAYEDERALCVFNMSREQASFRHPSLAGGAPFDLPDSLGALSGDTLILRPYAAWLGTIK